MPGSLLPALALATAFVVAGCVFIPLGKVPKFKVENLAVGAASIKILPRVQAAELATDDVKFETQAVMNPWKPADVQKLVLRLYRVGAKELIPIISVANGNGGGEQIRKEIRQADLEKVVTFEGLAPNTTYRVRGWAYSQPVEDPTLVINALSTTFVDIKVADAATPGSGELPVKLIDKFFGGEASTSIDFVNGTLIRGGDTAAEIGNIEATTSIVANQ
jgi:hypothetical protein